MGDFEFSKDTTITMSFFDYERLLEIIEEKDRTIKELEERDRTIKELKHEKWEIQDNLILPMERIWYNRCGTSEFFDLKNLKIDGSLDVKTGRMVYLIEMPFVGEKVGDNDEL